jgi:type 1 fimbriae regulatory protein FimB/type 1 fimbriae regulatory protein FimE
MRLGLVIGFVIVAMKLAYAIVQHDGRALQAYLGHNNIQHAVRYTELSPTRFKDFWPDR